jgi:isopenicillin-N N-acyltransferase like protein
VFAKLLAILLAVQVLCSGAAVAAQFQPGEHGPASLKIVDGIPVMHLYGTPQAMGEQHGNLVAPQIKVLIEQYLNKLLLPGGQDIGLRARILKLARRMEESIPEEYVAEMKAIARAAKVDYDDVLLANTVFDIKRQIFCTTVVAVGDRSADGQPIFGRNLDFATLGVAHKYSCVIIYHPTEGRAVASVGFPMLVGVLSGMNDAGVSAAVMEVHLRKARIEAMPYAMVFRKALTEADDTNAVARAVQAADRTSPNNLMICDAKGNAACAELGVDKTALRRAEDGILYATNHFRAEGMGAVKLCWRIPRIKKELADSDKVGFNTVRRILERCHWGNMTMQSMVFRPATREILLAIGEPPVTRHRYVRLAPETLFPAGDAPKK